MKKINSIEELKEESKDGAEFFILLNGNLRSSKNISYDDEEKNFYIINYIDDTEQTLSEEKIMDKNFTNIGEAMKKGALFKD